MRRSGGARGDTQTLQPKSLEPAARDGDGLLGPVGIGHPRSARCRISQ